ncbi:TIGR03915 family putative DNA repair protein [Pseudomonas putida]|uniref:TIGR03915 family putative DNA repair protein n=2 Tax=Pseudomonas TaxID=286 RepID=A0A7W2L0Q8_PSEPU|nr:MULTISPECIES: TIGR03915 family putative DNA repair protein [Pseudomonas]MBA6116389.1 TIGR03915 family putative DNA repair protein [Pseudomonas putida]MBI6942651.1 TIGR03915 family putative DNA repair protein [Pseudomonas putida]MBI6958763.1 TIGR03915 family putative DNA repair protein [Pseudomonas putida]MCZ9639271.1 TIGR03915 family putative DNA repair protein [Pseudomonas putida]MEC4874786.1 TIGR03915 family putative DNA repair protein [Pseudomonas sp. NC26]
MGVIALDCGGCFGTWREQARALLAHGIDPAEVTWGQGPIDDLLAVPAALPTHPGPFRAKVPAALLGLLEQAARYRGEQRWNLLYEVLWRVAHGDRTAMLAGDRLGSELHRRIKQVSREAHHLHAFVRFVPLPDALAAQLQLDLVAYHEPAHDILLSASGHFADRLGRLRWLIATPQDGIRFDGKDFDYRHSCPDDWRQWARNADDPGAELWRTYYRHTFNPARLNPDALRLHMPGRFWRHLPEGMLIPQLEGLARQGKQRDGQAQEVASQRGKQVTRPTSP